MAYRNDEVTTSLRFRVRLLILWLLPIYVHAAEFSPLWLVKQGLNHSDTISIERNRLADSKVSEMKFSQKYSLQARAEIFGYSSRLKNVSAFAGDKTEQVQLSAELSREFSSGTKISLMTHSQGNKNQQAVFSQMGMLGFQQTTYNEALISFSLKQQLWKNAFGSNDRSMLSSIRLNEESVPFSILKNLEDYSEYLVGLYYNTWSAFKSMNVLKKRLQRERRRMAIYQKQFNSGFVESTDILQLKSTLIAIENQLREIKFQIEKMLIVLGKEIHQDLIGPYRKKTVKVQFYKENLSDIGKLCARSDEFESYLQQNNQKILHSLQERGKAIEPGKANVYFEAKVATNAIDKSEGKSFTEATTFKTPQYYLGMGISHSFGSNQERAEWLSNSKQIRDLELKIRRDKSNLESELISDCLEFDNSTEVVAALARKARLENQLVIKLDKKYRIGKTDLNRVNQAESNLSATNNELIGVSAAQNKVAWKIRRAKGHFRPLVEQSLKGIKIE